MALDLSRLAGGVGFRVDGAVPYDRSTITVGASDLNGDGIADLVIGAPRGGNSYAGETFVVYGTTDGFQDELDLTALDSGSGFRVEGVGSFDESGQWIANAGDVNGDGVEDLVIVAPNGSVGALAYVLFGSTDGFPDTFDLADLDGDNGFRIQRIGGLWAGSISGAGDLNGDGFDDVVIGAPEGAGDYWGRTYVVFGAPDDIPAHLDVADLDGGDGFWLDGVNDRDGSGYAVALAGDLNGDGIDDLAIGALDGANSGRAYVVFGSREGFGNVDLATLDGSDGFRIDGTRAGQHIGATLSPAGDINGDGIEDLVVAGWEDAVFIVFGSTGGFDPHLKLADLDGTNGFRLTGVTGNEFARWSAATGDLNGDGLGDLILTPRNYDNDTTYLIYGHADDFAPTLDVTSLDGGQGARLVGVKANALTAGDVDGNGVDDVIIGTYDGPGSAYVVFGTPRLGGANEAPVAADDDLVVGSGSVVDLTDDHGAGFDADVNFDDLAIAAIDRTPLEVGDRVALASGLGLTLVGATEARFDISAIPFGTTLDAPFSYEISDGRGGTDVASVSVRFLQNDVHAVDGTGGFRVDWSHANDRSGYSVGGAGDVNGDGVDDVIIGAPYGGKHDAGRTWVVFGSPDGFDPRLNLADLDGKNGFAIRGGTRHDHLGWSVGGAGDVNGDGVDDIIVGAPDGGADHEGRTYVIFGSAEGFDPRFYLHDLNGENGFGVRGIDQDTRGGMSVAGVGDVDGDGFNDIGISRGGGGYDDPPARAYVVHGSASGFEPRVNLSDAPIAGDLYGLVDRMNVADAGDINGDGFADLLFGTPRASGIYDYGLARIVLGAEDEFGATVSFGPDYDSHNQGFGASLAAAGDINGDGLDDLIVANSDTRISYVVFGSEEFDRGIYNNLDEQLDGVNGFRLVGAGSSVDGAGDFDGDGVDDLIVSSTTGDAFLVLGHTSGFAETLDLATLSDEFRFTGAAGEVAGAGDLNDDGYDDLILGSPHADPHGRHDAGSSYVIYGHAMENAGSGAGILQGDNLETDAAELARIRDMSPTAPDSPFL